MERFLSQISMKHIVIVIVLIIGGMIATGNMGGAKKATANYVEVRKSAASGGAEARPSPLAQMIEYNKHKGSKKAKEEDNTTLWVFVLIAILGGIFYMIKRRD